MSYRTENITCVRCERIANTTLDGKPFCYPHYNSERKIPKARRTKISFFPTNGLCRYEKSLIAKPEYLQTRREFLLAWYRSQTTV